MTDKRWNSGSCFKRLFDQEDECCQGCRDSVECMEGEGKPAEYPKVGPVVKITRKEAVFIVDKLYETLPALRRFAKETKKIKTTRSKCCQITFDLKEPEGRWRCSCSCGKNIVRKNGEFDSKWDGRVEDFRMKHKKRES